MEKRATVAKYIAAFKKKLCDAESCPSDSSLRTYAYAIAWLEDRMEFVDGKIPPCETVLEYLENAKVTNTRRAGVYTALKKWYGSCGDRCNCDKYSGPLVRAKQAVDAHYRKQQRTKKQSKNWVEHGELKKFANQIRDETYKLDKHGFWSKEQFMRAQLGFILLFHLRYPIRRDLATVRWSSKKNHEWKEDDNYLDAPNKTIVLQRHKVWKHKGTVRLSLSRQLWRLWALLRRQQVKRGKEGKILLNKHYKGMTANGFSSWMAREMKACPGCEKKDISCMIIRHCCITHKRRHEMTNDEKAKYAEECMHSEKTNNEYRAHT